MHTCYSLSTNEAINEGLANLNHLTRLLIFLALTRVFSSETTGKRPSMDDMEVYLYTPLTNIPVGVNLSRNPLTGRSCRGDRTLRCNINGY